MLELTFKKIVGKALLPENRDPVIIDLFKKCASFDQKNASISGNNLLADNPLLWDDESISRIFDNSKYRGWYNLYVVEYDSTVIAVTATSIQNSVCQVFAVYVDEEYRRKGVCTYMFDNIKLLSDEQEFTHMTIEVMNVNKVASETYRSYGFKPYTTAMFLEV